MDLPLPEGDMPGTRDCCTHIHLHLRVHRWSPDWYDMSDELNTAIIIGIGVTIYARSPFTLVFSRCKLGSPSHHG